MEIFQCLEMGALKEGSKDLHSILEVLAYSKLRVRGLARGSPGKGGIIVGEEYLSVRLQ
jgi:hypothetical protein